jgi:hypothetical protein
MKAMRSRIQRRNAGSSTIEFVLVASLFLVPLLLGLFSVGLGLIRDMQGVQLTRDVGHMWARGVDFSTQANQDLLATRLAQGLSLVSIWQRRPASNSSLSPCWHQSTSSLALGAGELYGNSASGPYSTNNPNFPYNGVAANLTG